MGSKPIEWSAIRDEHDRAILKDMYEAAQKGKVLHKLRFVKDLMDPLVREIAPHVEHKHSTRSFLRTLMRVRFLAEHGFEDFLRFNGY
jgi:hypothetical protein